MMTPQIGGSLPPARDELVWSLKEPPLQIRQVTTYSILGSRWLLQLWLASLRSKLCCFEHVRFSQRLCLHLRFLELRILFERVSFWRVTSASALCRTDPCSNTRQTQLCPSSNIVFDPLLQTTWHITCWKQYLQWVLQIALQSHLVATYFTFVFSPITCQCSCTYRCAW